MTSVNKIFIAFIAFLLIAYIGTVYFSADNTEEVEKMYRQEIELLQIQHQAEIKELRKQAEQARDSLTMIIAKRQYTITELKNKPGDAKTKIIHIVREYHADQLDSVITSMFSDISRFD